MFRKSAYSITITGSALFRSSSRCFARQSASSKVGIRQKGPSAIHASEVKANVQVQKAVVVEKPAPTEADTIAEILAKYAVLHDDGVIDEDATQA